MTAMTGRQKKAHRGTPAHGVEGRLWARARSAVLALYVVLLSACATKEVTVSGMFPPPLVEPLPITIGVWYEPEFANHEFYDEAKGRTDSTWIVKTGEAQVEMWSQLLERMFAGIRPLDARPAPDQMNPAVDAVLIPRVDELQYAIPAHTNIKVYEIWMRYAFELVTTQGEPIAEWTMTAYGKTPTAFLQSDEEAVRLAGVVALRDAGAHFITSFQKVPEVAQWLESRQTAAQISTAP
ncbi:MAG: hypothetical protein V2I82_01990 [Halieaceae bacterium]|jgi:hypothetical protein|nr:hypothetical protein [Halieaceae bacterium]